MHGISGNWQEVCFLQCLSLADTDFDEAITINSNVEFLGGSGFQKMHRKRTPDDEVATRMNLDSPTPQIQGTHFPPSLLLAQRY